ncbi:MAG: polyamine aminopropyltransferase [Deltaproteobacteria bacterium]|nr:polyamine aminopropyltransferase [Deltaproteobacteria bacterium]
MTEAAATEHDDAASTPSTEPHDRGTVNGPAVLFAVFLIATCGLIYELVAAALSSYLLGDSVTQFSTVIGAYLSAMGIGAWLSRSIDRKLARRFVEIELAVGLVGGFSAALLFLSFARFPFFRLVLYGLVGIVGVLVGLEIPLLMRILKDRYDTRELVARVLSADYIGALVASLFFPLFLVPNLGLVRGALVVGAINAGVALWSTFLFEKTLARGEARFLRIEALAGICVLGVGISMSQKLTSLAEEELYADHIVFAQTSLVQRIVLTRSKGSFSLFLNGNLQFSSADEHRYHEALVHPAITVASASSSPSRVLILGGGDGLALREVFKHAGITSVKLVDLDPAMTKLASTHPLLVNQNQGSMSDPRLSIENRDAFVYLEERVGTELFDVAIVDFPDPNNFALGKLYTRRFYQRLARALAPDGAIVVQATSPLLARKSFWTIVHTMSASGLFVRAYHANVPSFGEWGFALAAKRPFAPPATLPPIELKYLSPSVMRGLFELGPDVSEVETEVNRLDNQVLVRTYESEWARWY